MDTERTEKIKRLYEITNGLLDEMVKEEHIELDKYLKPEERKTLNDVYEQALSLLCNRDRKSNYIKFEDNRTQLKEILFDFNPVKVKERYSERVETLIDALNKKFSLKIDPQKKNSLWVIFGKGIISVLLFCLRGNKQPLACSKRPVAKLFIKKILPINNSKKQ